MDIGARVKLIRGDLLQEEFASRVGVSKITVGRWERGERVLDHENLNAILRAFPEINPTWLLTGEGPTSIEELNFDLELLRNVISILDNCFDILEENELTMEIDKKAKWIAFFYEEFMHKPSSEKTRKKIEDKIYRFLELSK